MFSSLSRVIWKTAENSNRKAVASVFVFPEELTVKERESSAERSEVQELKVHHMYPRVLQAGIQTTSVDAIIRKQDLL